MVSLLRGDGNAIRMGTPSAVIFNPALAKLQQALEKIEKIDVSPADIQLASSYVARATEVYDDETSFEETFHPVLEDGQWHRSFLLVAFGLKNLPGLSGDALLQAVIDYSQVISQSKARHPSALYSFPLITSLFFCSTTPTGISAISPSSSSA